MQMNTPQYVHHQLLRSQSESQPLSPPSQETPPTLHTRPAGRYGPGSYEVTAFSLDLSVFPPSMELLFPLVLRSSVIKSCWPLK